MYTFSVRANNSVEFGKETLVMCATIGNVPNGFTNISICLNYNVSDTILHISYNVSDTLLHISYNPCPFDILDDNTPPVTNYTLNINNEFVADLDFSICNYAFEAIDILLTFLLTMLLEVVIKLQHLLFLYGLQITHLTETSAVIQYTRPNCVIQNDLMVKCPEDQSISSYIYWYESYN